MVRDDGFDRLLYSPLTLASTSSTFLLEGECAYSADSELRHVVKENQRITEPEEDRCTITSRSNGTELMARMAKEAVATLVIHLYFLGLKCTC